MYSSHLLAKYGGTSSGRLPRSCQISYAKCRTVVTIEPVSSITRSSLSFSPGRSTHAPIRAVVGKGSGRVRPALRAPFWIAVSWLVTSEGEPTAVTHPSPYAPTASHALGPLAAT